MKQNFLLIIVLFMMNSMFAQNDKTLFEIDGEKTTVSEFLQVYTKNNNAKQVDYSKQSLEEYLELYINYKLKVSEAFELKMDTIKHLKDEYEMYRNQLSDSYLIDSEITEELLRKTYDRTQHDVEAAHILVRVNADALPQDTLKSYQKIMQIRDRIIKGEDFNKVAKEMSEDPSAKENMGKLGYFTAFQMVYQFEDAAFNTKVGEVSLPVRTQFGYHLVKVTNKRKAKGEVEVAHIYLRTGDLNTKEQDEKAKEKIFELHQQLKEGADFKKLAKEHSQDPTSTNVGGKLPKFGTGKMLPEFEKASFALRKDGEITSPVKSTFGWHIIKRLSRDEPASFEESKNSLKSKLKTNDRAKITKQLFFKKLEKKYNYNLFADNKKAALELITKDYYSNIWKIPAKNNTLFELAGEKYSSKGFYEYLKKNSRKYKRIRDIESLKETSFNDFKNESFTNYEKSQLPRTSPEFKRLVDEYQHGILIFDLMEKRVWKKALEDTTGLKQFHTTQLDKYKWNDRIKTASYSAKDKMVLENVKKLVQKGKSSEKILSKHEGVIYTEEKFEKGKNATADELNWKIGAISDIETKRDDSFTFLKIIEKVAPTNKSLEESRGFVITDYQSKLEKDWIQSLRTAHKIKINEKVLNELVK